MTLTSAQHDYLFDQITWSPADDSREHKPYSVELYMVETIYKRMGSTFTYDNDLPLRVGITKDQVEAATNNKTSVHNIVRESTLLDSDFHYIPPDNEQGLKPSCTRYTWADWQMYCNFKRAGVTDASTRYQMTAEKTPASPVSVYKTDVRYLNNEELKADIKALGGVIELNEAVYQSMKEEADAMLKRVRTNEEHARVAQIYDQAKSIAEQTIEVVDGVRKVRLDYKIISTGRAYARRSAIQGAMRVYKKRLLDGYNYDIKSCHDSILRFLFDQHDVELPDWPDKDAVDLPNEMIKPLSHAIKQTGTRQIPSCWEGVYRGYREKCDVARMIWEYAKDICTIPYEVDEGEEMHKVVGEILEKLHEAYGELEAGLQELEYKLETAEHPLGLEKKENKKTLAHHLQGWEAVVMIALAVRDPGTVLLDHDGYITQSPPEKVQQYWDEVVPAEIAGYLELVEKPIAKESDEAKRREILNREPREANTESEKANTLSRKERTTKRRTGNPTRRTRQSSEKQVTNQSTLEQAVAILAALPTREARRLLLKAAPKANGMTATLPVNQQPGYENGDEIRALFQDTEYRYVIGGFKPGRLKSVHDRHGHNFKTLQSALKKHNAEELLDMTKHYVETGEINKPEPKSTRKRKRQRKRSRTRTRTNRQPAKRSRPSPKERERKREAELEYAREVVAST